MDTGKEIGPDLQSLSRHCLVKCFSNFIKPVIKRWTKTQTVSVYTQLQNGIRHFDIRVAYRQIDKDLYFVHGLFSQTIIKMCKEMSQFLKEKPKEVVIIDFQHFYNLNDDQHMNLIEKVRNIFDKKICPSHKYSNLNEITLSELWSKGYQVIICYRKDNIVSGNPDLWPSSYFPNPWANTYDQALLFPFISNGLETRSLDKFFITQAIFTPTNSYAIKHFVSSLHCKLVEKCNRCLNEWLIYIKRRQLIPNIIIADYVDWQDYTLPRRIVFLNYKFVQ